MSEERIPTPIKAIRTKCIDCCAGNRNEVRLCVIKNCALYPYRLGKNPNIKRSPLSEEQRNALRIHMKKIRKGSDE